MGSADQPPQQSPEISLRPFRRTDADDYLVWAGDDRVTTYTRWDTFKNRDQALDFLEHTAIPAPWYRAICLEGKPVGCIFVRPGAEDKDRCRGEIGYALAPHVWGRGIATAAVRMALSVVFNELPWLERVEGLIDAENLASQRVLDKCGFVREGVLRSYFCIRGKHRDIVVYSIISGDIPRKQRSV